MVAKWESVSAAGSFVKMVVAALKVFTFMAILTIMVIVCLCTSHAVPQHVPSWMAPAWQMLETLPRWEAGDSMTFMSEWVSRWQPSVDLVAYTANIRIVLEQSPFCFWVVASVSICFLVLHALLTAMGFVRRCMHLVVTVVYPRAAKTEIIGGDLPSEGSGTESKINSSGASRALVENKVLNTQNAVMTDEKKAHVKGAQKRVESPAPRAMKPGMESNKEDIPPKTVSSVLQKQPESHEETKGAWKRSESPAPRAAKAAGIHPRSEALPATAQSALRKQEVQAHRQRIIANQNTSGMQRGVWNQGGSAWPGNVWQGGGWQGNGWTGHNGVQWGRNGWYS
eukprot:gnl/MRDRNA2_/MRDRNA2_88876_c0_seq1.p1 gnl/MRDRNA2_/MRDRNA2_88876_c0~~gnl/MRDRNA2_/MRDRNA2_88876_c0_seq1.p1  ORF type:complete len:339 (-),score=61.67 gnl/MRDRNA2_/MRDRNA2_88876_c0_seq1:288-1304(-)